MRGLLVICSLMAGLSASAIDSPDVFAAKQAGVTLTKPATWIFAKTNDVPTGVIVLATRYTEPVPQLNPSLTVTALDKNEVRKRSAKSLAKKLIAELKSDFPGVEVIFGPRTIEIDGLAGSGFEAHYSIRTQAGTRYDVAHRTCFVRRGDGALRITLSGPQSGPDASEKEIEGILKAIQLTRPQDAPRNR